MGKIKNGYGKEEVMDERMEEGIERVMEDGKDKEWIWEGRSDG